MIKIEAGKFYKIKRTNNKLINLEGRAFYDCSKKEIWYIDIDDVEEWQEPAQGQLESNSLQLQQQPLDSCMPAGFVPDLLLTEMKQQIDELRARIDSIEPKPFPRAHENAKRVANQIHVGFDPAEAGADKTVDVAVKPKCMVEVDGYIKGLEKLIEHYDIKSEQEPDPKIKLYYTGYSRSYATVYLWLADREYQKPMRD